MRKLMVVALAMVVALCVTGNVFAANEAAEKECIAKCEAAAAMFKEKGLDATIAEINKKDGPFVSPVTYVFLQKMDGTMLAHPMNAALIGKNMLDTKDKAGKAFIKDFADLAKEKGSGWVEYMWPKPGEETPAAKNSYVLKIGDDMFVGAGYYK